MQIYKTKLVGIHMSYVRIQVPVLYRQSTFTKRSKSVSENHIVFRFVAIYRITIIVFLVSTWRFVVVVVVVFVFFFRYTLFTAAQSLCLRLYGLCNIYSNLHFHFLLYFLLMSSWLDGVVRNGIPSNVVCEIEESSECSDMNFIFNWVVGILFRFGEVEFIIIYADSVDEIRRFNAIHSILFKHICTLRIHTYACRGPYHGDHFFFFVFPFRFGIE